LTITIPVEPAPPAPAARRYSGWLWLLAALFAIRVAAQPAALLSGLSFLPSFESWHSGVLPYGVLLASQFVILAWLGRTAWRFTAGTMVPSRPAGRVLIAVGGVYFVSMLVRLILGLTILHGNRWFASPLPAFFHLVLASYLLLAGHFHWRQTAGGRIVPWLHYPAVMIGAFSSFAVLQNLGASLVVSTYLPVLLAAGVVTLLERRYPFRVDWRPPASEVGTDLAFMTVVQLAFPPLMGFLFTYALIRPARALDLPIARIWPHSWPYALQALLMVLVVDFLRYWLHRASHQNDTLWRLHSVHHSVEQLYWLNTARFHLIEKAMQMTLDSLPFLLMQVDATVLSLYYLAYATNGFFQHCNVDLRYGFLNYFVGSADTHRWHHSREPRESNANYGSTVIVWDLLFGTWFLPRERTVRELGLRDPDYPKSFVQLMRAPFVR
jgi:sterol desaturase/sphingolipid hydroxylase (fatty acid hydroxylase superfamily)